MNPCLEITQKSGTQTEVMKKMQHCAIIDK